MSRCFSVSKVTVIVGAALIFTGCDNLTGESPKIVSDDKATPVADAAHASKPSATPVASPGSAWNEVAQNTFAEKNAAITTPPLANADLPTTAPAAPTGPIPNALTAPDPALAESPGLFLRQAQNSSVFWRSWSPDAFREAEARGLPVLIMIGSAWSHDAAAMDNQVFTDPEISAKLNTDYVPIRVDADERPDIWSRYRMAYEAINKQLARPPLMVFALADGRPFDVVGPVPARGSEGNSGMLELMSQASEMYKDRQADVTAQAASIETVLAQLLAAPRAESADLSAELLDSMADGLASASTGNDSEALRAGRVGGFLLHHATDKSSGKSREAASELLLNRFRSGQRDHVMGGYFLRIPGSGDIQYGKLLPVQAEMISANARAFAATGKGLHKEGVTEVLRFCRDWLESPDGGFFACQAPDIGNEDSGGYFTWSREEINQIAEDEKSATVFSEYLNAQAGEKTNLHVTGKLQQAADTAGVSYAEALKGLDAVRVKLRNFRIGAEQVPMVDKSILAGWNADMVVAYLEAAELVGDETAREFALKTADMIVKSMVSEQDGVARVLYKGKASGYGFLADNVKVASALLKCYQVTNQQEYLDSAQSLMEFVEERFLDSDSGLYQDVANSAAWEQAGLLKLKRLPIEDDISRSPNAVAAMVWYQLSAAANKAEYKGRAERMVKAALERRPFNTEAVATWGEAGLMVQNGPPSFKR